MQAFFISEGKLRGATVASPVVGIESAPRTGEWFFAFEPDGKCDAHYACQYIGDDCDDNPLWAASCGQYVTVTPDPTHWMPLPPAPGALPPPPPSVVQELVEALTAVIEHFDRNASKGNAPGHGHQIAGVWDTDVSNGARGGNACEWCAEWASYRALLTRVKGSVDV